MSNPLYSIKDWDRCFENSESRKIRNLSWTPFPNRHDSAPFRRVAALKNSPEIFAAWVLIVQIASKMPVRGVLQNSAGPLTTEDLALMTGFPEQIFSLAFDSLQKPGIQWISVFRPSSQEIIPERPGMPGHVGATGKGTEGKGNNSSEKSDFKENLQKLYQAFKIETPSMRDHGEMYEAWLELTAKGCTIEDLAARVQFYRDNWTGFPVTRNAIFKNWHSLKPQPIRKKRIEVPGVDYLVPDSLQDDVEAEAND